MSSMIRTVNEKCQKCNGTGIMFTISPLAGMGLTSGASVCECSQYVPIEISNLGVVPQKTYPPNLNGQELVKTIVNAIDNANANRGSKGKNTETWVKGYFLPALKELGLGFSTYPDAVRAVAPIPPLDKLIVGPKDDRIVVDAIGSGPLDQYHPHVQGIVRQWWSEVELGKNLNNLLIRANKNLLEKEHEIDDLRITIREFLDWLNSQKEVLPSVIGRLQKSIARYWPEYGEDEASTKEAD